MLAGVLDRRCWQSVALSSNGRHVQSVTSTCKPPSLRLAQMWLVAYPNSMRGNQTVHRGDALFCLQARLNLASQPGARPQTHKMTYRADGGQETLQDRRSGSQGCAQVLTLPLVNSSL
jgi:hypothetical protein